MRDSARLLGFLAWFLVSTLIGFGLGRRAARNGPEPTIIRDTVTYTTVDTIVVDRPVYVTNTVYDTVKVYFTTIQHDSVLVDVPMERRVYEEDSLYRAVVTGWRPELESLTVYPKTTTITITNTVKTPAPRWSLGVTAGPSVLATPKGQIHAGLGATIGVQYRF